MEFIGFRILAVAHEMKRLMDENLKEKGLTFSQIHVLGYLDWKRTQGEACNQREIGSVCCNVRPSSVSILLQNLQECGYIERKSGEDARMKFVSLTEKGTRIAQECKQFTDKIDRKFTEAFTEEERGVFLSFLLRGAENLKDMANTLGESKCSEHYLKA